MYKECEVLLQHTLKVCCKGCIGGNFSTDSEGTTEMISLMCDVF